MSLESTVGIAKVGTKSLRATVPEGIVAFLKLQEGDKLEWRMELQNNERITIVKKKPLDKVVGSELAMQSAKQRKRGE
jgi:hypothetical protein